VGERRLPLLTTDSEFWIEGNPRELRLTAFRPDRAI
jgi:hypothetical protein